MGDAAGRGDDASSSGSSEMPLTVRDRGKREWERKSQIAVAYL